MKKILLLFLLFVVVISIFFLAKAKVTKDLSRPVPYPTITPSREASNKRGNTAEHQSLFVPYWTLQESLPENYDRYLYFGITPDALGIDTTEQGSSSLMNFLEIVPQGKQKLLTLRMIEQQTNFVILKDSTRQRKLIIDTVTLAKQENFDGVVLDLEVTAIPFESLVNQITSFTTAFSQEAKKNNLKFAQTIYGDVFYRIRPFAVKELARESDEILIMAYDFSKARGNPGPNFPLKGKEVYGYDMSEMIDDFLLVTPASKLTIVFGLYGYDWEVDEKGNAVSQGKALTYNEIKKQFMGECPFNPCDVRRKNESSETEIRYTDSEGKKHVVWFEDPESVKKKKVFLKQKGITSFSFWAHGYF